MEDGLTFATVNDFQISEVIIDGIGGIRRKVNVKNQTVDLTQTLGSNAKLHQRRGKKVTETKRKKEIVEGLAGD